MSESLSLSKPRTMLTYDSASCAADQKLSLLLYLLDVASCTCRAVRVGSGRSLGRVGSFRTARTSGAAGCGPTLLSRHRHPVAVCWPRTDSAGMWAARGAASGHPAASGRPRRQPTVADTVQTRSTPLIPTRWLPVANTQTETGSTLPSSQR